MHHVPGQIKMKGRKDLVWVDHRGVAHGLREYDPYSMRDGYRTRTGVTWCGQGLNLSLQYLRKRPMTCMTCIIHAAKQGDT